jgi:hypothetical protein
MNVTDFCLRCDAFDLQKKDKSRQKRLPTRYKSSVLNDANYDEHAERLLSSGRLLAFSLITAKVRAAML